MHVMSLSIFYQFVREVCMCTSFTLKIVYVLIKKEIQIPANIFFFFFCYIFKVLDKSGLLFLCTSRCNRNKSYVILAQTSYIWCLIIFPLNIILVRLVTYHAHEVFVIINLTQLVWRSGFRTRPSKKNVHEVFIIFHVRKFIDQHIREKL